MRVEKWLSAHHDAIPKDVAARRRESFVMAQGSFVAFGSAAVRALLHYARHSEAAQAVLQPPRPPSTVRAKAGICALATDVGTGWLATRAFNGSSKVRFVVLFALFELFVWPSSRFNRNHSVVVHLAGAKHGNFSSTLDFYDRQVVLPAGAGTATLVRRHAGSASSRVAPLVRPRYKCAPTGWLHAATSGWMECVNEAQCDTWVPPLPGANFSLERWLPAPASETCKRRLRDGRVLQEQLEADGGVAGAVGAVGMEVGEVAADSVRRGVTRRRVPPSRASTGSGKSGGKSGGKGGAKSGARGSGSIPKRSTGSGHSQSSTKGSGGSEWGGGGGGGGATILTAVCIAGAMRTFLQPVVQEAFVVNVHHRGYEYFVSTDHPRPPPSRIRVGPIRVWLTVGKANAVLTDGRPDSTEAEQSPRGPCPDHTCNSHRFVLPMAQRLADCYHSIVREEGRRRGLYHAVFRLRPDHLFQRRLPSAHTMLSDPAYEASEEGTVLLYDDQMAVARRSDAAAVLMTPVLAYDTCATDSEWRAACGAGGIQLNADWSIRKCRAEAHVPCCSMALVTVFGSARGWRELPWEPRDWADGLPRVPGVFCIKRTKFANETRVSPGQHDCKTTPGCMDC